MLGNEYGKPLPFTFTVYERISVFCLFLFVISFLFIYNDNYRTWIILAFFADHQQISRTFQACGNSETSTLNHWIKYSLQPWPASDNNQKAIKQFKLLWVHMVSPPSTVNRTQWCEYQYSPDHCGQDFILLHGQKISRRSALVDWLRFYIPPNIKWSFWRCSSQPICWLRTEKLNLTIKASNTEIKWFKLSQKKHKMLNLDKCNRQKQKRNLNLNQHANLKTVHMCARACVYHHAPLSYTIQHRMVLIIFPPYLQTIIIALMLSTEG